jgi:hypothetical protein
MNSGATVGTDIAKGIIPGGALLIARNGKIDACETKHARLSAAKSMRGREVGLMNKSRNPEPIPADLREAFALARIGKARSRSR